VSSHSEYRVALAFLVEFDDTKPTAAELGLLEACIPELMAALLDATPDEEE
jgi:hypothetical protein